MIGRMIRLKGPLGLVLLLPLLLTLSACGGEERERAYQEAVDTLTRRQKDSLISEMAIPGAGAVGKALRVADSVQARANRIDSIIRK